MRNRKATTADFLIAGFLFLLVLAVVVPFINTIAISFSTQREYLNTPLLLIPRKPTLNNYINLLRDKRISIGYLTSLKILLLGLPINLFLTVSLAYGTSRKNYPGKRLILGAILFTMLFNGGILPLYLQMRELHLTNTIWSVILASGINVFYFVLARNYFCSLPEALIESAQLDGAGEWKILFSIILPISKPILATLTLFYMVDRWNEWYNALIFIHDNSYTRYQGAQKFYVQGTSGLTLEDGHAIMITYIRNGLAEQGLDPDKVLHLAQLVGDDGMYHYREDSNYWGQVMFSPTISQEKFERAMDILDYTCTEEGQNIMNMGFEGIDWKRDENGNYVSLLDPSIQGSATSVLGGKYPSKESSFGGLILPDDFSLVSPNYNHEIQNTVRNFYKLREELSDETTLLPREYEYEFLSSREKSQATMDLGDEYAKLVLKDGDLEDNWNTWVEEKMAVVQPVLDQLNK